MLQALLLAEHAFIKHGLHGPEIFKERLQRYDALCRGVVHRDLKLENLLLATPQDITKVKIADFGLAKKAAESQMETICGTPQYVAPEVIQASFSTVS